MQIYAVFKNADFTEGRGPMIFAGSFKTLQGAKNYINKQGSGIFGAKPPEGVTLADWCLSTYKSKRPDGSEYESRTDGGWGGFEIREGPLGE